MDWTETTRPRSYHPLVREMAAQEIADEVAEWCGGKTEASEIVPTLAKQASRDAYEFARNLERYEHWDSDYELVEILTGFSTWNPLRILTKQWVERNNIQVDFSVGDDVIARGEAGTVVDIDHAQAKLTVQPKENDGQSYGEKGGWIINAEDAAAIAKAKGEQS